MANRLAIPTSELKLLLQKSGNRCAFPGCGMLLTITEEESEGETAIINTSNIAHIVADSIDGPRGKFDLPFEKRNLESNLILLCEECHTRIDSKPELYSVERLRGFKEDHERLIREATGNAILKFHRNFPKKDYKREVVYSTLFEVIKLPVYVFQTSPYEDAIKTGKFSDVPPYDEDTSTLYPYIIQDGKVYTFQNPTLAESPFLPLIDPKSLKQIPSRSLWDEPVKSRWFVNLLNNSINAFMTVKGLSFDYIHKRFYFALDKPGEAKEIEYRPLNQERSTKKVAWQPITKKTSQPKPYWLHRAVSLHFYYVSANLWCLSLRPEFRVTKDGLIEEDAKLIGSKVTKKKSRMFNYDLLSEINFWRSFLSNNEPRIIINFGSSHLIISSALIAGEVEWPGIPEKYEKSFSNVEYADDLFTWAKLRNVEENDEGMSGDDEYEEDVDE